MSPGFLMTIETFGEVQLSRELQRVGLAAEDATPAWEEILRLAREDTKLLFESSGSTGMFGAWAPIKETTLARKQAQGLRPEVLIATGALVTSLTEENEDSISEVDPLGLSFGTKLPYGAIHYKGSAKVPLPRRRPIDFSELQRREFVKVLQRWIIAGEI